MKKMCDDVKQVLFTEEQIVEMNKRLGKEITEKFKDEDLVVIGLLNGCLPFMSDVLKYVDLFLHVDYMKVSSYCGATTQQQHVAIKKDFTIDITGKTVLLVDDVLDTGDTILTIKDYLLKRGAAKVYTCVLVRKDICPISADFCGAVIGREFIIGYGLDYNEKYRNLPYIGTIKEEAI